jgi:metallo-beta-lactamase class B
LIANVLALSSMYSLAQETRKNLEIHHLTGDFYVFTTYNLYKGNRIPANGMYAIANDGAILIDAPWDTTQFQPLRDSIKARHDKDVVLHIATHFHEDRTAGLEFYSLHGARTYTTRKTDELSKQRGMKRAEFLINKDTTFSVGQYSFQTYYPGEGHTPDNIVIWFEKEKVLYGGCLIKSVQDTSLGNLADANVNTYAATLENVQRKFIKPKFIIPGHNSWKDIRSLEHTLRMAKKLPSNK